MTLQETRVRNYFVFLIWILTTTLNVIFPFNLDFVELIVIKFDPLSFYVAAPERVHNKSLTKSVPRAILFIHC